MAGRRSIDNPTYVRAVAEYQLFSDEEGFSWMNVVLTRAMDSESIEGFHVFNSFPGAFGLQLVIFSVDLYIPATTQKGAKNHVRKLLNDIVFDKDVDVRWIVPLD